MSELDFGALRALIVDDEMFSRKVLSQVLNRVGIRDVVDAEGGAEALAMLNELADQRLDVIVADIRMPDMDGYELTRRIRYGTVAAHKDVAIVILSGHLSDENLRHARTHKIDALVAKPASVDVLKLEIAEAIKRAAARRNPTE